MISAWCDVGAGEVEAAKASPAVQSVGEMQRQMNAMLPDLNRVATRLYSHWVKGVSDQ